MEMMTSIGMMAPLDLAALAAVVLIGLPHGALDGAIAIHLGFTRGFFISCGFWPSTSRWQGSSSAPGFWRRLYACSSFW